jgi:hypothetical protein
MRAHGRGGVVKRLTANASSLVSAGIMALQNRGLEANLICELTIPDVPTRSLHPKGFRALKRHVIAHDVITGSRHLVRDRLQGDHLMAFTLPTLIEPFDLRVKADGKVGRLHKCPSQIRIAVFGVASPFDLAVAQALALDAATVGGKISDVRKASNRPRFSHNRQRQNVANAGHGLEPCHLGLRLYLPQHLPLHTVDLGFQTPQDTTL